MMPAGSLILTALAAAVTLAQPPRSPNFDRPDFGVEVVGDRPIVHCRRTSGPIRVDGLLDERDWKGTPSVRDFKLSHGKGSPAWQTRVKALWDDRALYLAFECDDRDIFSPYKRRDDALYNGEVVEAFLATGDDRRRYVELEVSPANVLFDARVVNLRPKGRMTVDPSWNAKGLRSAVRVRGTLNRRGDRDRGWTVELVLPFADLDLPRPVAPGDAWPANFYRIDRGAPEEFSAWSPTLVDPPNFHVPARFGKLVFVGAPVRSEG